MNDLIYWRLKYIIYGLREAHKRFHKNLKTQHNSLTITASLSELLFWINTADEWHFRNNNKQGSYKKRKQLTVGGQYIEGLRFAYNSLKHEMTFIKLIRPIGQKEFIKGYDLYMEDYSTDSIWLNVDNLIEENLKYQKERENYQKYVEGKKVVKTVDEACKFQENLYFEIKEKRLLDFKYNEE